MVVLLGCIALLGCVSGPDPPSAACERLEPEDRAGIVFTSTEYLPDTELWTMSADAGDARRLVGGPEVSGSDAAWSPDGCSIAFVAPADPYDLYGDATITIVAADGRDQRRISRPLPLLSGPEWSPDGQEIAFIAGADQLFKINIWSGRDIELTPPGVRVLGDVAWSPDGTELVFPGLPAEGLADLYSVRPDGSGLRQITETPEDDEYAPSWSPDGRRLAFDSSSRNDQDEVTLVTSGPDGEGRARLTSEVACCATWSPDGRSIVFQRFPSSTPDLTTPDSTDSELWKIDVETGEERRLALVPAPAADPSWSRHRP
jgi:TolB protein